MADLSACGERKMSDAEIDAAIASLRSVIGSAEMTLAKLIAQRPARYITLGQATAICGRSESQVRKDCEANPVDRGGFGSRDRRQVARCARQIHRDARRAAFKPVLLNAGFQCNDLPLPHD
jgi:hypothetical protein